MLALKRRYHDVAKMGNMCEQHSSHALQTVSYETGAGSVRSRAV